jgi:hypothetical protein
MDGVAFPTVGSLVIVFQVRNSVRPMHLSVTTAIMITTSNSPIKWGAGYPINYSVTQGSVTPASSRGNRARPAMESYYRQKRQSNGNTSGDTGTNGKHCEVTRCRTVAV